MKKYAKVIDEKTKACEVGLGDNTSFYESLGMTLQDVEKAYNGSWYLAGCAPEKPADSIAEKVAKLEAETGLTRAMRELILSKNVKVSDYLKNKAQEIEDLAEELRNG